MQEFVLLCIKMGTLVNSTYFFRNMFEMIHILIAESIFLYRSSRLCSTCHLAPGLKTMEAHTLGKAFSENEKVALLSLIKGKPVVVSKRQAPNIQQEKKQAWEEIRQQYSQMFPPSEGHLARSTISLKRWWDNYKQK